MRPQLIITLSLLWVRAFCSIFIPIELVQKISFSLPHSDYSALRLVCKQWSRSCNLLGSEIQGCFLGSNMMITMSRRSIQYLGIHVLKNLKFSAQCHLFNSLNCIHGIDFGPWSRSLNFGVKTLLNLQSEHLRETFDQNTSLDQKAATLADLVISSPLFSEISSEEKHNAIRRLLDSPDAIHLILRGIARGSEKSAQSFRPFLPPSAWLTLQEIAVADVCPSGHPTGLTREERKNFLWSTKADSVELLKRFYFGQVSLRIISDHQLEAGMGFLMNLDPSILQTLNL